MAPILRADFRPRSRVERFSTLAGVSLEIRIPRLLLSLIKPGLNIGSLQIGNSNIPLFRGAKIIFGRENPQNLRNFITVCHSDLNPQHFEIEVDNSGAILGRVLADGCKVDVNNSLRKTPAPVLERLNTQKGFVLSVNDRIGFRIGKADSFFIRVGERQLEASSVVIESFVPLMLGEPVVIDAEVVAVEQLPDFHPVPLIPLQRSLVEGEDIDEAIEGILSSAEHVMEQLKLQAALDTTTED